MNRKQFMSTAGLGALGLCMSPELAEAEESSVTPSAQRSNVKITAVKSYYFKKANYVKIETNQGVSGWGESDGASKKITGDYIEEYLKEYLIGQDPFNSEEIWHTCYLKGIDAGIGGIHPGSLAGIDNALWDLKGKLLDMPVHKLLGGNGITKIRMYGSYGRLKGDRYQTPEEMAKKAAHFVEQGYKAVKARMQIRQENVNPYPDDIFEVTKAIRHAIGDDIELFIDFNNGYTASKATVMAKKLYEHFNIAALEEPVFQQDYEGLRQVVEAMDIPVMAGEHEYNRWMMRDLIVQANVDILNADVIKCGGISECKKTATLAHAFGKEIMVHNAKPTLATAASLQLLASITNGARFQEYAGRREEDGYGSLFDLFDNYFTFKDGFLEVPNTPGLGLAVNEKMMDKLAKID